VFKHPAWQSVVPPGSATTPRPHTWFQNSSSAGSMTCTVRWGRGGGKREASIETCQRGAWPLRAPRRDPRAALHRSAPWPVRLPASLRRRRRRPAASGAGDGEPRLACESNSRASDALWAPRVDSAAPMVKSDAVRYPRQTLQTHAATMIL
jgi:hypothetical protein